MSDQFEHRALSEPIEFRGAENGTAIRAVGVAMRYGARSKPIGGQFVEQFKAGAFAKSLQEQEVRSHLEHHGPYLGRTTNGSLRLADGPTDLRYELDLPDTTAGRDAAALLERQDLRGSSIGFRAMPKGDLWAVDEGGLALRTVSTAHLGLIDLTVAPAYDESTAAKALRSLAVERGMEVRSLLEAADRGELPTLIASPQGDETEEEEPVLGDDGSHDGTEVVRERIAHLYL